MCTNNSIILLSANADRSLFDLSKSLSNFLRMKVVKNIRNPKNIDIIKTVFELNDSNKGILLSSTKKLNNCTFFGMSIGVVCTVEQIDISNDFFQTKNFNSNFDFTKGGYLIKFSDSFDKASEDYTELKSLMKNILSSSDLDYTWVINVEYKEEPTSIEIYFTEIEKDEKIGPSIILSIKSRINKIEL